MDKDVLNFEKWNCGYKVIKSTLKQTWWFSHLSRVTLVTPWAVARQVPLSMGFSRQEYWSGLPFSSPGYLPDPRVKHGFLALQAYSLPTELPEKPLKQTNPEFLLIHGKMSPANVISHASISQTQFGG